MIYDVDDSVYRRVRSGQVHVSTKTKKWTQQLDLVFSTYQVREAGLGHLTSASEVEIRQCGAFRTA